MAGKVILHHGGGGDAGGHSVDCTAKAPQILEGYTAIHNESADLPGEGSMPNKGAWSSTNLNAGASVSIPAGYHNGSGSVSAKSLAAQTGVDSGKTAVTAAAMLSPYQGWVNGTKVSGEIVSKTDSGNVTLNASTTSKSYAAGYYPNAHGAKVTVFSW